MKEAAEATAAAVDHAAQGIAHSWRGLADTVNSGVTTATSEEAAAAFLLDTPAPNLRQALEDNGAEGVEYWAPGTEDWGKPAAQRFDTVEMEDAAIEADSETGVRYLDDEGDRQPFRLDAGDDGLLYDAKGEPFDTTGAEVFDRWGRLRPRRALFVMDADGSLYSSLFGGKRHKFQHSSFLAGGPVAGAGEIEAVNGELRLLNDISGHYMPGRHYTMQVVSRLRELGVRVDSDQLRITAPE